MDKKFKVLVLGDIMFDQYTYVSSTRRADEADIPVWDEVRHEYRLGGAANVAHNLKALGQDDFEVHLAGICGWTASRDGRMSFDLMGIKRDRVMGHETMVKRRFVDPDGRFVMRLDNFKKFSPEEVEFFEMVMNYWEQDFDAVVFSDYDKGTITPAVVEIFRKCAPLLVVDSKRRDLRIFDGMHVLKVNEREYAEQVSSDLYHNFTSLFQSVVVTRGAKGATLIMCDRGRSDGSGKASGMLGGPVYTTHAEEFPVISVQAKDVTGCGDTHTAAMTFSMLKTGDMRSAVKFANACASHVVQKFGTSVPTVL